MDMQDYFKVGGPVDLAMREAHGLRPGSDKIPYQYLPRKEQVQYAERVAECLDGGSVDLGNPTHILAIEAETGVGKTLGALIPLCDRLARHLVDGDDHLARGALATYTVALRRQITGKDLLVALRAVEIATGQKLEWAEYWGANQFVSQQGVKRLLEEMMDSELVKQRKYPAKDVKADMHRLHAILRTWYPADVPESELEKKGVYFGTRLLPLLKAQLDIPEDEPLLKIKQDRELMGFYDEVVGYPEYQHLREAVRGAHLVLMSHAATLLNGLRKFTLVGSEKPLSYLVMDEAHKIPDAAKSLAKRSISLSRVELLLDVVKGQTGIPGAERTQAKKAIQVMKDALEKAYPGERLKSREDALLYDEVLPGTSTTIQGLLSEDQKMGNLNTAMKAFAAKVSLVAVSQLAEDVVLSTHELLRAAVEVADFQDAMAGGNQYSQIIGVSWSPTTHKPSLLLTAMNPGRLIARYWRHYPGDALAEEAFAGYLSAAVITSATLPSMSDLGLFDKKVQDLPEGGELEDLPKFAWQVAPYIHGSIKKPERVEPVGHFGRMRFVLTPASAPQTMLAESEAVFDEDSDTMRYVNPEWEATHLIPMIQMMMDVMQPEDRAVVLTPSYADIDEIVKRLRGTSYAGRLLPQSCDIPMLALARAYQRPESAGKVMISTGGWEGIDLPGMVQHLMIARIPRPPVDSLMARALRQHYLKKRGEKFVSGILHNQSRVATVNKLRQGIGRGIRKRDDEVTVWIADKRFGVHNDVSRGHADLRLVNCRPVSVYRSVIPDRFFDTDFRDAKFFLKDEGVFDPVARSVQAALPMVQRKSRFSGMGIPVE